MNINTIKIKGPITFIGFVVICSCILCQPDLVVTPITFMGEERQKDLCDGLAIHKSTTSDFPGCHSVVRIYG